MSRVDRIADLLRGDPLRWHLLELVAELRLPDSWIAAGFVRNAVWDHLHGREVMPLHGDVDVIWYDPTCIDAAEDRRLESVLAKMSPSVIWNVKNQARMHIRNGDAPYTSASHAMMFWPETATAIAARRHGRACEISAPLGLDDLFDLVLRPTSRFCTEKRTVYEERVSRKLWTKAWPLLKKE